MKRFIFLVLCLFASYAAYGQDLIVTVSGDSLNCKITEVKSDAIFFRYDASGNIVSLPMPQVVSYKYDFYKSRRGTPSVAVSMRGRSEVSLYFGGGLSSLVYKPDIGSQNMGTGGMFGIGYTWFVSGRWGLLTGIEASLYQAEYVNNSAFKGSDPAMSGSLIPSLGNDFVFSYEYQKYSEKQTALFLQIPLMTQFQTGRFFASAGIKIGVPINCKYNITNADLTTMGDFPYEIQIYDDLTHYGLGYIGPVTYSGNLDLNVIYAAAFEAGGQWFLGRRTNLYVGVWLDYGLNNLSKIGAIGDTKSIVEYDHRKATSGFLKYNSIVDTIEKTNGISAGLKVKLTYSL